MSNFHISLPCLSVTKTKNFYTEVIGVSIGRSSSQWVDVDLFENQITFCKSGSFTFDYKNYKFEKTVLPSFHFGVILKAKEWNDLKGKLDKTKHIDISDTLFLAGKPGEHRSFFVKDPNGYYLEFKCFSETEGVFDR